MVAGRQLTLEVGRVGPLADAVVFAKYGATSLLVSAVSGWELSSSSDFIPLQVDYREKAFAAGQIPSTYTRREASASDRETLAARIIDRSLRPLFPKGYAYDTQLICSVLSFDKDCDPAFLSVVAASAALAVSSIPWNGPVAAVRVGWVDGAPVLAPTFEQDAQSKLSLLLSATDDKVVMMEIGAAELPERAVIEAMRFAHDEAQPLLALQRQLVALAGKPKRDMPLATVPAEVLEAVRALIWEDALTMYRQHHYKKAQRGNAQRLLFLKIKEQLAGKVAPAHQRYLSAAGDLVMKEALRAHVYAAAAASPLAHVHPLHGPATAPSTPHLVVGDAAVTAEGRVDEAVATAAPATTSAPAIGPAADAAAPNPVASATAASDVAGVVAPAAAAASAASGVAVEVAATPAASDVSKAGAATDVDVASAAAATAAPADAEAVGAAPAGTVVESPTSPGDVVATGLPAPAVAVAGDAAADAASVAATLPQVAVVGDVSAVAAPTVSDVANEAVAASAPASGEAAAVTPAPNPTPTAGGAAATAAPPPPPLMLDDDPDNALAFRLRNAAAGGRPDGRASTDIRTLRCEVDVLPRVHGSAVFARGDTEVLCTTTLGSLDLAQLMRPLSGDVAKKAFFLHYDFPPYCTNEVGKVGGANRRMVGHGALAERALLPVMPDEADFPYTIRATSEVSGSDGSSSMATVCGVCLALMDAGVPIRTPVAGISIGVFSPPAHLFDAAAPDVAFAASAGQLRSRDYVLLTDIFGLEDHSGDMDFKIGGSRYGVTAAQLDVKPAGLPLEVLEQALWRARDARLRVLDAMAAVMARPRSEIKDSAPRIEQLVVPPELMGRLIGPGGVNVKRIMNATGARVQIDRDSDNPLVSVYADRASLDAARTMIHATLDEHRRLTGSPLSYITSPTAPVLTVGTRVEMRVLKVHEFGVVLGTERHECGWMHIAEFSAKRTAKVTDLLMEGDEVVALVVDVDPRGRAKFSLRAMLPPGDYDVSQFIKRIAPRPPPPSPSAPTAPAVPAPAPSTPVEVSASSGGAAPSPAPAASTPTPTPAASSRFGGGPAAAAAPPARRSEMRSDGASQPSAAAAAAPAPVSTRPPLTVTDLLRRDALVSAAMARLLPAGAATADVDAADSSWATAALLGDASDAGAGASRVYAYLAPGIASYAADFAGGRATIAQRCGLILAPEPTLSEVVPAAAVTGAGAGGGAGGGGDDEVTLRRDSHHSGGGGAHARGNRGHGNGGGDRKWRPSGGREGSAPLGRHGHMRQHQPSSQASSQHAARGQAPSPHRSHAGNHSRPHEQRPRPSGARDGSPAALAAVAAGGSPGAASSTLHPQPLA